MALRTISVGGVNAGFYNGDTAKFNVISDTGPVYGQAKIISASMELNSILTTRSDIQLLVKFNSASASPVAKTGALKKDASGYWNTTTSLTECTTGLLGSLSSLYLTVSSGNTSTALTDIVFSNSIIMIDVEYMGLCEMSGAPYLSASQSTGNAVVLQWPAGYGGAGNALSYYEVVRETSTNGVTWSGWETVAQTANTYAVVQPPATVGHYYRYYVRAVGTAGAAYASSWFGAPTLKRIEITRCGTPGNVTLSASESSGSVNLTWTAASNGIENSVSYYEVERNLSTDGGSTWGVWEHLGRTTGLNMWVDPPATDGHMYRFYVRAVGSAGEDYASYWVQCSKTLKKVKAALIAYTDPEIVPGITKVKAAHITELQTNVNLVRTTANYAAYTFTDIRASYTSLAGWNTHITELRAAIDGMGISHETWLALGENCPRADVIMQLRRVVEAVAK